MPGVDFGALALVYNVSGRITESGIGVSNIIVQAGNQTTNTDSTGNYVFSGLCPGSYTVTPSQGCRLFNPASVPVTLGPNASGMNFITFSNNLSRIRGQITDGVNGLSNVLVTATGGLTAMTDANGNYEFSSLCPGTYTVTPSLTNLCLNTPFLTVTLGSAQTTNGVDFVAIPGQFQISGTLAGMPPGPNVAVSIAGPSGTNVLLTSTGAYGISNLCPGTYSVTPSNACYQFYPLSWTTTVGPSDDSLDFVVSGGGAFSIGGQVTHNGVGLSNVTVIAAGQTNVTDASGNYILPYLCPGVYAVTASALNFQFNPATNYVTLSSADSNGVNFAAFQVASLSGRVVQGASGLPGVKVSAGTNISFTGAGGYYTNLNLPEGTNVLVVPSLGGYAFAPSAQSLMVLSNTSLPDFMAFPSLALAQTANGAFQLTFAPAFTCQVLASGDLSHWQPVLTTNNVSTNTPLLQFTDSNAANLPTALLPGAADVCGTARAHQRGHHRPLGVARLRGGSGPGLPDLRFDQPYFLGDHLQHQPPGRRAPSSSGTRTRLTSPFASTACPKRLVFEAAGHGGQRCGCVNRTLCPPRGKFGPYQIWLKDQPEEHGAVCRDNRERHLVGGARTGHSHPVGAKANRQGIDLLLQIAPVWLAGQLRVRLVPLTTGVMVTWLGAVSRHFHRAIDGELTDVPGDDLPGGFGHTLVKPPW